MMHDESEEEERERERGRQQDAIRKEGGDRNSGSRLSMQHVHIMINSFGVHRGNTSHPPKFGVIFECHPVTCRDTWPTISSVYSSQFVRWHSREVVARSFWQSLIIFA